LDFIASYNEGGRTLNELIKAWPLVIGRIVAFLDMDGNYRLELAKEIQKQFSITVPQFLKSLKSLFQDDPENLVYFALDMLVRFKSEGRSGLKDISLVELVTLQNATLQIDSKYQSADLVTSITYQLVAFHQIGPKKFQSVPVVGVSFLAELSSQIVGDLLCGNLPNAVVDVFFPPENTNEKIKRLSPDLSYSPEFIEKLEAAKLEGGSSYAQKQKSALRRSPCLSLQIPNSSLQSTVTNKNKNKNNKRKKPSTTKSKKTKVDKKKKKKKGSKRSLEFSNDKDECLNCPHCHNQSYAQCDCSQRPDVDIWATARPKSKDQLILDLTSVLKNAGSEESEDD